MWPQAQRKLSNKRAKVSQISEVLTFCMVLQNRLLVKLKLILNHRHRSSIPESGCGLVQAQRTAVFSHCRILYTCSHFHHGCIMLYTCVCQCHQHRPRTSTSSVIQMKQLVNKSYLYFRQQAVTAITCTCKQVLFWQQVIMGITYACKQAIFQQQAVMGKEVI